MIGFRKLVIEGIKNPRNFFQIIAHLPQFIKLYYRLFKDPRVPLYLKFLLVVALLYVFSPIDIIPDFFQLIGQVDDLVILLLILKFFLKRCPRDVLMEHVRAVEAEGFSLI